MKKIKNIALLVSIAVLTVLGACEDVVNLEQPGRLGAANAFQTVDDLQLGLLGVYSAFDNTPAIQFNAIFTDELSIGVDNGGQGLNDGSYGFVINPQSAIATVLWTNYYGAINSANRVIEAADLIEVGDGETARFNDILGQAFALRAWAHFELQTYFTPDYTDDSALGVILVDFVPTVDQVLGRNTNAEVFGLISADLDMAASLVDPAGSDNTFVTQSFITALRARMAAYRGNYTAADGFAASLIADFPLATTTQYEGVFADTDNTEVIYKLERAIGDPYDGQGATGSAFAGGWAGANFAFVNSTIDGSPYFEIGRSLFNLMDEGDIRRTVAVDATSVIDPDFETSTDFANSDVLVVSKYEGSGGQPLLNDLKIFRTSEMLLIRAEAAADRNDLIAASQFIQTLRTARFGADQPLPVLGTQADAFAAILDERRVELCFEGHRWVDLKRLGTRANRGIERHPLDCAVNGACNLAADDFRFTLPIPLVEINGNSVIGEQQNPGY